MPADSPSDPTKDADLEGVRVSVEVATSIAERRDPMDKTEATMRMKEDEALQAQAEAEARAFAMSLDDLAAANPPDQLYEDLTGERPKSPIHAQSSAANQTNHDLDADSQETTNQSREAEPTTTEPPRAQARPTPVPMQTAAVKIEQVAPPEPTPTPPVAPRRSPRRHASSKASAATNLTKKASTSGSKRSNQQATQSFSWNDILHVQNLIERCLQQLLSKNDIVLTLQAQAKVDPSFTAVVWQKLEEQNPAFFRAYALQLQLKEQITAFNFLVSQQKEMMAKASGNAAFLSFLASSDARKTQRQAMIRNSRMANAQQARNRTNTPSPHFGASSAPAPSAAMDLSNTGFPLPSPLPLPSPMKTDLDTHAFFS